MLGGSRAAADRADLVRAPGRDPAARRRRGGAGGARAPRGRRLLGADPERDGGSSARCGSRDRFDEVNLFLSASETHNRKNVNRSIAESLAGLERVIERAAGRGPALRGRDLDQLRLPLRGRGPGRSGCSRSPSGSPPPAARRSPSATRPGWRTRARWASSSPRRASASPASELTAHFHNTRGQGLANVLAALEQGVDSFESSLRRARRLPGAARVDRQHLDRGPGLDARGDGRRRPASTCRALIEASRAVQEVLGRPLGAHVLTAGPVDWHPSSRANLATSN